MTPEGWFIIIVTAVHFIFSAFVGSFVGQIIGEEGSICFAMIFCWPLLLVILIISSPFLIGATIAERINLRRYGQYNKPDWAK